MTEPHDMAAVRRIIRNWRYPLRMTVGRYLQWCVEGWDHTGFRLNSRNRQTACRVIITETPPDGRD